MARWCYTLVVVMLAVSVYTGTARDVPRENKVTIGLADEKNLYNFGGTGGFAGFGNNGLPTGGMGTGGGVGGDFGGANGIGGVGAGYQYGGPAGGVGTFGGFGGLPTVGGGVFGGAGGGGLGGGGGGGGGAGGVLPSP